jgi:hypothetical protein
MHMSFKDEGTRRVTLAGTGRVNGEHVRGVDRTVDDILRLLSSLWPYALKI